MSRKIEPDNLALQGVGAFVHGLIDLHEVRVGEEDRHCG